MNDVVETVPPPRRPKAVTLIAGLGLLAASACAGCGLALILFQWADQFEQQLAAVAAALLLIAWIRFSIARGLLQLRDRSRRIEVVLAILGSILGLAFIALGVMDDDILAILLGLILAIPGLPKWIYLTRPRVREAFAAGTIGAPKPSIVRRTSMGLAGVALVIVMTVMASSLLNSGLGGRTRSKRTMADMRSIATAVESYAVDMNAYPQAQSLEELAPLLQPTYIRDMPRADGWEHAFRYGTNGTKSYRLASAGKGGDWETTLWNYKPGQTSSPKSDLVFENGSFIRYPERTQP